MPIFDLACTKCAALQMDVYVPVRGQNPACAKCAEPTEPTIISLGVTHKGTSVFPYTTTHITGKPIEIKSPGHLQEICKVHNVRLRDDNAFLEQERIGYDFKTRRQVYHEGSGLGMKGSWI